MHASLARAAGGPALQVAGAAAAGVPSEVCAALNARALRRTPLPGGRFPEGAYVAALEVAVLGVLGNLALAPHERRKLWDSGR
eukprot:9090143-Pyramimonas_sp.AAC.1